jgi:hypothetical protein
VIYRRKKMLYHASHQDKLEQGTDEWFSPRNPQSVLDTISPVTGKAEMAEQGKLGTRNKGKNSKKAVTFVETTASVAKKTPLSAYGKSAVLTGVTMSQAARRGQLDIPPIPRPLGPQLSEIKCPYCSHLITEELGKVDEMQNYRWRCVYSTPKSSAVR